VARVGQVSALALFSGELRQARSRARLTQDQLAEKLAYRASLVAHVERAGDVARLTLLYDILKAEALPRQASIDLAREAIDTWT
jgi:hypothetical protein